MNNYIVIQDWMFKDPFNLSGNEVILFGLIYGFSQDGRPYKINKSYIAKVMNIKRITIQRLFKSLSDKGIIHIDKYKYCGEVKYKCLINVKFLPQDENLNGGFRQL